MIGRKTINSADSGETKLLPEDMFDSLDHCDWPPKLLPEDMFDSLDHCDFKGVQ